MRLSIRQIPWTRTPYVLRASERASDEEKVNPNIGYGLSTLIRVSWRAYAFACAVVVKTDYSPNALLAVLCCCSHSDKRARFNDIRRNGFVRGELRFCIGNGLYTLSVCNVVATLFIMSKSQKNESHIIIFFPSFSASFVWVCVCARLCGGEQMDYIEIQTRHAWYERLNLIRRYC